MFVGSLGLIVTSSLRFAFVKAQSFQEVMMNIYYLALGVLLVVAQLQLKWV
jgi:hypothetical protein